MTVKTGRFGKITLFTVLAALAILGVLVYGGNGNSLKAETAGKTPQGAVQSGDYAPRSIGSPDAPVVITEFASLTCSHCATFHNETFPRLKADYVDTGKVRFVFSDFPLNKPAFDATLIARCLPEDRYVDFVGLLFKTQEQWISAEDYLKPLRQNAKLAGLNEEAVDACLANVDLQKAVTESMSEAQKAYEVNSTPSFIFNGGTARLAGAQPYEAFKAEIEKLLAGKAADKAE